MASRHLFDGKQISYDDLIHELNPGDQLAAAYLDNVRNPRVRLVPNEGNFIDVIKRSYDPTEPENMTGSTNPSDYGMIW